MHDTNHIRYTVNNGIAQIMLNRPDARNAIALATSKAICLAVDTAEADVNVRVIVITGAGDSTFSAGADLNELPASRSHPDKARQHDELFDSAMFRIKTCRKPTVARINAHVIGGAFTLIMACDLRLSASSATFRIPVAKLGLMYTAAETAALTVIIGPSRAKWLMMTGRAISAAKACNWGLIDEVFEDHDFSSAVDQVVREICQGAPLTHQITKTLVDSAAQYGTIDETSTTVAYETIYTSADAPEGLAAYAEKRKPDFRGN